MGLWYLKRQAKEVKYPEFKHVCGDFDSVSYREGWNACLEECKRLNGKVGE